MTKKKSQNKPASTQKYLQIERIREGVVILKDGRLRKIIKCLPVNFDLKSEKEKEVAIYQYQSFLNSLKFPIHQSQLILIHEVKVITILIKRLE